MLSIQSCQFRIGILVGLLTVGTAPFECIVKAANVNPVATAEYAAPPEPQKLAEPQPVSSATVSVPHLCGEWSGKWISCTNGHTGPLKATFRKIDQCHYEVRFRGRFCKIIPFYYTTVLTVTSTEDGRIWLQASERLGPLLGTFSMNGSATSAHFLANFRSKDDHGQFSLQRCN